MNLLKTLLRRLATFIIQTCKESGCPSHGYTVEINMLKVQMIIHYVSFCTQNHLGDIICKT